MSRDQNPFSRSPYSKMLIVKRYLWHLVWLFLLLPSPKPCFFWRHFWFRCFGGKLGKGSLIYPTCAISEPWNVSIGRYSCMGAGVILYSGGGIEIGSFVTISQYSHLCSSSHDYTKTSMPQTFSRIRIEDKAWVCTEAFVAPGITIGEGAIAGARAVVTKNVEPWSIVAGNPARFIKRRVMDEA